MEYFETHVRPLLASRCYSCHSQRSGNREGGLVLDSRSGWVGGGDNGTAVIPGDVETSLLIRAIRYSDPELQMPPDKALPASAIARLERWVKRGAADPRDDVAEAETSDFVPSDPIAGRQHWAYRPLQKSPPTSATLPQDPRSGERPGSWIRSPIESFVFDQLRSAGLQPAPDADPLTLARRIFIQLVGLPPTSGEIAAFVDDDQPGAVERMVDRLLASPQFGQRWGRHWLDLARYADSNGLDENFLFRQAWRYRNQVIDSFNADVPLDQFFREQIAGDLLPYDSISERDRQRIAAGFLVVGPKVLLINESERMQQRMDVADELIDTIGKSILGQTLGCARCHDHKFDPIPTSDYYELAFQMQSTIPCLMDLSHETKETLNLYGVDSEPTDNFGRQCLLARKFAESGVRYIQVSTNYTWDHHKKVKEGSVAEASKVDRPIAGLLTDLQRRGLLDDTLVVWGAEFGRTPTVENGDGRNHHPKAFTMWMAGGGCKPGLTYGATDEFGYAPIENPVHMHDLHATLLYILGLDHEKLTYRHAGRDFRLTDVYGNVVHDILA